MLRRIRIAAVTLLALFATSCAFRPIFHPPSASADRSASDQEEGDTTQNEAAGLDEPSATGRYAGVPSASDGGIQGTDAGQQECADADAGTNDPGSKDASPESGPAPRLTDSTGVAVPPLPILPTFWQ